jgi:hypothetical protein
LNMLRPHPHPEEAFGGGNPGATSGSITTGARQVQKDVLFFFG